MKKIISHIALLCLAALLLQGCTGKSNPSGISGTSDSPKSSISASRISSSSDQPSSGVSPSGSLTSSGSETSEPIIAEAVNLSEEELRDKIVGGWVGQMVGVTQGASTEFCYAGSLIPERNVPKWNPEMINDAFNQDDLYVEIPFLDAMKSKGADCDPKYIATKFKNSQFALWHANYMGRENLKDGISYPDSGSYLYNYHADDIDWQIECDFLGMMYPGMVNEAAKRAFELGHIMNYGDGVYGGVFVTAMHAAAFTAKSVEEIWQAGVAVIPEGTQFRALIDDVVKSYREGATFEENWKMLETKWAPGDLCPELPGVSNIDAKLNSGYILLGLLYGEGDMDKTITISMRCGQDSDCNPSTAASILGNYYGAAQLDKKYTEKLDYDKLKFSYTKYTFNGAVDLNLSLMKEMLEKLGATRSEDGIWTIQKDVTYTPVEFEQWPDGVFAYFKTKISGNVFSVTELTTYSKNENITGYVLDMGDGFRFTDVTPAYYTYAKAGTYTVTLKVTGDKGSVQEITKEVTVRADLEGTVDNTIIVCSVTTPGGGGSRNIDLIRDGIIPSASGTSADQYDTYTLGDPHGDPDTPVYIGYIYREKKTVSSLTFTEGQHFGNGGWFKDGQISVELLINGSWTKVNCTSTPAYPKGNSSTVFGKPFESYTFNFDKSYECDGIRISGIAGGSAGFISVSELAVG